MTRISSSARTLLLAGLLLAGACMAFAEPREAGASGEAPGTSLFITKVRHYGTDDAIELFNPTADTIDFSGWYLGTNDGAELIGVPGNRWSVLLPLEKRILRRGEPGSFTTDLDYLTVLYLFTPEFVRVEQIAWSRPDNFTSPQCVTRDPDTGGFHDGFDWYGSGGDDNPYVGQIHYIPCHPDMNGPEVAVGDLGNDRPHELGLYPNPVRRSGSVQLAIGTGMSASKGNMMVTVTIHDIRGRELYRALREQREGAPLLFTLGGADLLSAAGARGIVFVTASTPTWRSSKPLILLD